MSSRTPQFTSRLSLVTALSLALPGLVSCSGGSPAESATSREETGTGGQLSVPNGASQVTGSTYSVPLADTYLRADSKNKNEGATDYLEIQGKKASRSLLSFDLSAAADAQGVLVSARVELQIKQLPGSWGNQGKPVSIHRVSRPWTESGATWNCAVDEDVSNSSKADCSGATTWGPSSGGGFDSAPLDTLIITKNTEGPLSFDVTADVQAVLAGQSEHFGWLLKKGDENDSAKARFWSREATAGLQPLLVLEFEQVGGDVDGGDGDGDSSSPTVTSGGDGDSGPGGCRSSSAFGLKTPFPKGQVVAFS